MYADDTAPHLRWLHISLGSPDIDGPAAQIHLVHGHGAGGELLRPHLHKTEAPCALAARPAFIPNPTSTPHTGGPYQAPV